MARRLELSGIFVCAGRATGRGRSSAARSARETEVHSVAADAGRASGDEARGDRIRSAGAAGFANPINLWLWAERSLLVAWRLLRRNTAPFALPFFSGSFGREG